MDASIVTEKLCKKCGKVKQLDCFYKQRSSKDGLQSYCINCHKSTSRTWQIKNPDKLKINLAKSYANNIGKRKIANKIYYEKNKIKLIQKAQAWSENNRSKCNGYIKQWVLNNKHKKHSYTRTRQAKKIQAMPTWADATAIRLEYELAAWCTKVTGEKYHVDHIIPLQGKNVCGLHVHNNLRVVLALENLTKSNKFDVL